MTKLLIQLMVPILSIASFKFFSNWQTAGNTVLYVDFNKKHKECRLLHFILMNILHISGILPQLHAPYMTLINIHTCVDITYKQIRDGYCSIRLNCMLMPTHLPPKEGDHSEFTDWQFTRLVYRQHITHSSLCHFILSTTFYPSSFVAFVVCNRRNTTCPSGAPLCPHTRNGTTQFCTAVINADTNIVRMHSLFDAYKKKRDATTHHCVTHIQNGNTFYSCHECVKTSSYMSLKTCKVLYYMIFDRFKMTISNNLWNWSLIV